MRPATRRIITQITALRMAHGWNQETTATQANLYPGYLSEIERLIKSPLADTIDQLAELFNLELTITPVAAALLTTTADIGTELRRLRHQRGLTLDQLGETTGIAPTNLSSYENDRRRPDLDTILRILDGLDCRLAIVGNTG